MSIYNSSYSLEKNSLILRSIYDNGLSSTAELQKKGVRIHTSGDRETNVHIYTNAYSELTLRCDFRHSLYELFHHYGAGLYQIAYERIAPYAPHVPEEQLVCERLHNCILFVLNPQTVLAQEELSPIYLNGETLLTHSVPSTAFSIAFVPSNLTPLFSSIFPHVQCQEVGSITKKYYTRENALTMHFNPNRENYKEAIVPDFETAVTSYAKGCLIEPTTLPLFLHLLRLTAPSDEMIEKIQLEANNFADLRTLNQFDVTDPQATLVSAQKYQKLKDLNQIIHNQEFDCDLKAFDSKQCELVMCSPLCKEGSLTHFRQFAPDFFQFYQNVEEYKALKEESEKEKKLSAIFEHLQSTTEETLRQNVYNNLKHYLSHDRDPEELNDTLLFCQRSVKRTLYFRFFPEYIKKPENLARLHREIGLISCEELS